jgi:hypothetical protein
MRDKNKTVGETTKDSICQRKTRNSQSIIRYRKKNKKLFSGR